MLDRQHRVKAPSAPAPGEAGGSLDEDHRRAVLRVIEVLRQEFAEPISLDDMAGIAAFSPSHFTQLFCRVTGVPPGRFLTALRVQEAKRLLVDPHRSVTDITYAVGYNSPGTFSSRFAKLVGVSPRAFRTLAHHPGGSRDLDAFLSRKYGSLAGLFRTHKQTGMGLIEFPGARNGDDGTGACRAAPGRGPIFIGAYRDPLPQGVPVAYTIAFDSPVYTLPGVPDGRYHVFAASFRWSEDPRSYLLFDLERDDLLVGAASTPLVVWRGRARTRANVRMRRPLATDPPLLTALFHLMTATRRPASFAHRA